MSGVTFGLRLPVAGPFAGVESISRAAFEAIEHGWSTLWVHDFIVWTRYLDLNHVSCGSREVVEAADGPPVFHESSLRTDRAHQSEPEAPKRNNRSQRHSLRQT